MVGLGNPGIEYQFTPHNAGFLAIDRLADQGGVAVKPPLPGTDGNHSHRRPRSGPGQAGDFMNLSGISVEALVKEFDADPTRDLMVIYDEIALAPGLAAYQGAGQRRRP